MKLTLLASVALFVWTVSPSWFSSVRVTSASSSETQVDPPLGGDLGQGASAALPCLGAWVLYCRLETSLLRQTYWPGPDTVKFRELDSFLPSPVQMAPTALQSVVAGSSMVTSPLPFGSTMISHRMLLGLSSR